jgi:FixJ family two-component response regulator
MAQEPVVAVLAVVDDDDRVLESLDDLLSSAGYRVHVYANAEQFLSQRPFQGIDCLVSDIMMPGMSGLELLKVVRAESPNLPVILITARRAEEVVDSAQKLGAAFVFTKPFDAAAVLDAIRAAVAARRSTAPRR